MKSLKFVFSGAPCGGKTTTQLTVGAKLKASGVSNLALLHEVARDCPYQLNKGATFQTALWILLEQIRRENALEVKRWKYILCDRGVFDELPFFITAIANGEPLTDAEWKQVEFIRETAAKWAETYPYELIFLFRPLPLLLDPDRQTSPAYQRQIDETFMAAFKGMPNVVEVGQHSREERTKFVLDKIMEYVKEDVRRE